MMNSITKFLVLGILAVMLASSVAADSALDPYFKELQKNPDFRVFTEKDSIELPFNLLGRMKSTEYQYNTPWYGYLGGTLGVELTSTYDVSKKYSNNMLILNYNSEYYILQKVGTNNFSIYKIITMHDVQRYAGSVPQTERRKNFITTRMKYVSHGISTTSVTKIPTRSAEYGVWDDSDLGLFDWDIKEIIDTSGVISTAPKDFITFNSDDFFRSVTDLGRDLRNVEGENFANEYLNLRNNGIYVIKENDNLDLALNFVKDEMIANPDSIISIPMIQKDKDGKYALFAVTFYAGDDDNPEVNINRYDTQSQSWKEVVPAATLAETNDEISEIKLLTILRSDDALISIYENGLPPHVYDETVIINLLDDDITEITRLYVDREMEIKVFLDNIYTVIASDSRSSKANPKVIELSGNYTDPTQPVNDSIQFIINNLARTNDITNEFDQKLYITMTDFKGDKVDLSNVDNPNLVNFDSSKVYSFEVPANNCHPTEEDGDYYFCLMNIIQTIDGKAFEPGDIYNFYYYYGSKAPENASDSDVKSFQLQFPSICTLEIAPDTAPETKIPVGGSAHEIIIHTVGERIPAEIPPTSTPGTTTSPIPPTTLPTTPVVTPPTSTGTGTSTGSTGTSTTPATRTGINEMIDYYKGKGYLIFSEKDNLVPALQLLNGNDERLILVQDNSGPEVALYAIKNGSDWINAARSYFSQDPPVEFAFSKVNFGYDYRTEVSDQTIDCSNSWSGRFGTGFLASQDIAFYKSQLNTGILLNLKDSFLPYCSGGTLFNKGYVSEDKLLNMSNALKSAGISPTAPTTTTGTGTTSSTGTSTTTGTPTISTGGTGTATIAPTPPTCTIPVLPPALSSEKEMKSKYLQKLLKKQKITDKPASGTGS